MDTFKELVTSCRSYRRFKEEISIPHSDLEDLVDHARLTASTANSQALKFHIIDDREKCGRIFPYLKWAASLKDWDGPEPGERPSAYILVLCDQTLGKNKMWDEGITSQTIMLAAAAKGYGGCMIASCQRAEILKECGLDAERYALGLVLALGKPDEDVSIVPVGEDGSTTYYRDQDQKHYVPKRSLEDILV